MTRERTLVFGLKGKLDDRNVSFKNYVLHEVAISGEGSDKGPNELLTNGRMPLHETARNLNRHVLRIVRHDAVLIGSAPRGVILNHERFDIDSGSECGNSRPHGHLLRSANITLPASQSSAGPRWPPCSARFPGRGGAPRSG